MRAQSGLVILSEAKDLACPLNGKPQGNKSRSFVASLLRMTSPLPSTRRTVYRSPPMPQMG